MRVTGGSAKGRKLKGPVGRGFRPTTGRVKEFIFSCIGDGVVGSKILDLFAGTGSLGIDAVSRGADCVVFVERSPRSLKILRENTETCGFRKQVCIVSKDVFSFLRKAGRRGETFDFVLADPPFKEELRERIVRAVDENRLLVPEGLLIVEHEFHDPDSDAHGLKLLRQRRFGHCVVSIYG